MEIRPLKIKELGFWLSFLLNDDLTWLLSISLSSDHCSEVSSTGQWSETSTSYVCWMAWTISSILSIWSVHTQGRGSRIYKTREGRSASILKSLLLPLYLYRFFFCKVFILDFEFFQVEFLYLVRSYSIVKYILFSLVFVITELTAFIC